MKPVAEHYARLHVLASLCSNQFVTDSLNIDATLHQNYPRGDVIRKIVLRNILHLRVTGLLSHKTNSDLADWLAHYIRLVGENYLSQKPLWMLLRSSQYDLELEHMLSLSACRLDDRYRFSAAGIDRSEIINDAFVQIKSHLADYPFDLPLARWIDQVVAKCAYRQRYPDPRQVVLWELHDDIVRSPDLEQLTIPFDSSPILDIWHSIQRLSREDQQLLSLWLGDYSRYEIAQRTGHSPKTVSNRLSTIRATIRDDFYSARFEPRKQNHQPLLP